MMRNDATDAVVQSGADGDSVKLWCVYDVVRGDVESYHPSYAWAMDQLQRAADGRSASVRLTQNRFRWDSLPFPAVHTGFSAMALRASAPVFSGVARRHPTTRRNVGPAASSDAVGRLISNSRI